MMFGRAAVAAAANGASNNATTVTTRSEQRQVMSESLTRAAESNKPGTSELTTRSEFPPCGVRPVELRHADIMNRRGGGLVHVDFAPSAATARTQPHRSPAEIRERPAPAAKRPALIDPPSRQCNVIRYTVPRGSLARRQEIRHLAPPAGAPFDSARCNVIRYTVLHAWRHAGQAPSFFRAASGTSNFVRPTSRIVVVAVSCTSTSRRPSRVSILNFPSSFT